MTRVSNLCSAIGLIAAVAMPAVVAAQAQTAAPATSSQQAAPVHILLSEAEAKNLIGKPGVKLVDLRGKKDYEKGHLPGAISLPWGKLTVSEIDGIRNEVASDDVLAKEFGLAGLSYDDTIVLYDKAVVAGRGYIAFDYAGFKKLHVLDGGAANWTGPLSVEPSKPTAITFALDRKREIKVDKAYVAGKVGAPNATIIDGRVLQAFEDGHIPGAKAVPLTDYVTQNGKFKPREEVLASLAGKGLKPDGEIISYCGSGFNAANAYLFLKDLGFKNVKLYDASWDEWSRDPKVGQEVSLANFSFASAQGANSIGPKFLTQAELKDLQKRPDVVVLDVRAPADYIVGRIPDSVNVYWNETLDEKRVLKSRDDLLALYKAKGVTPDKQVIIFTRGGFQAAHSYTVLKLLGYSNVNVFDGKFEGWLNPAFNSAL